MKVLKIDPVAGTTYGFINGASALEVRGSGQYKSKGIYLNEAFKWAIVHDEEGQLVLIAVGGA